MSEYHTIHWDKIRGLPARDQLEVLADIAAEVSARTGQERARIVCEEVEKQAAIRKHGAQTRAAEKLGLDSRRLGQLYNKHN